MKEDASVLTAARRVVFLQPEYINRVEVKYVREAKDIGFRVEKPKLAVVPSQE